HGKDRVEIGEQLLRGGHVALVKFAFVHRNIRFADKVENGGQRFRGVQVVSKGSVKLFAGGGNALGHAIALSGGKLAGVQAIREIAQPLDRASGRLQSIEGKIKLLAVRNAGEREAKRRRFVALRKEVSQRSEEHT